MDSVALNASLFEAIQNDQVSYVRDLLNVGAEVNAFDNNYQKNTPLHQAALYGSIAMVNLLLQAGAGVNRPNANSETPLSLAVMQNKTDIVRLLIQKGALFYRISTFGEDSSRNTPLILAIINNHTQIVRMLLEQGESCEQFPLHEAAILGNTDIILLLLEQGVYINAQNEEGETPLHCAVIAGNVDTVKFLIQAGADVNALDRHSSAPLHYAVCILEDGDLDLHIQIIELLIQAKADINITDDNWQTPLHHALDYGGDIFIPVLELLIQLGANINASDKNCQTPLHRAADQRNIDAVKLFMQVGADVGFYWQQKPLINFCLAENNKWLWEKMLLMGLSTHHILDEQLSPELKIARRAIEEKFERAGLARETLPNALQIFFYAFNQVKVFEKKKTPSHKLFQFQNDLFSIDTHQHNYFKKMPPEILDMIQIWSQEIEKIQDFGLSVHAFFPNYFISSENLNKLYYHFVDIHSDLFRFFKEHFTFDSVSEQTLEAEQSPATP